MVYRSTFFLSLRRLFCHLSLLTWKPWSRRCRKTEPAGWADGFGTPNVTWFGGTNEQSFLGLGGHTSMVDKETPVNRTNGEVSATIVLSRACAFAPRVEQSSICLIRSLADQKSRQGTRTFLECRTIYLQSKENTGSGHHLLVTCKGPVPLPQ